MAAGPDPGYWRGLAVAVTGGAGFLGGAVVAQLNRLGAEVRVIRSDEHDLRIREQAAAAVAGAWGLIRWTEPGGSCHHD